VVGEERGEEMIIVKITDMLILITAAYVYLWESYIDANSSETQNIHARMPVWLRHVRFGKAVATLQ